MLTLFRWTLRLTIGLIILLAVAAVLAWYFAMRSLPDYNASYRAAGIGAEVEIVHEGPIRRDPIAVRVGSATVALRRRDAREAWSIGVTANATELLAALQARGVRGSPRWSGRQRSRFRHWPG